MVIISASSDGFGFHSMEGPRMRHGATKPYPVLAKNPPIVMCPTVNEAELPPSFPPEGRLVANWEAVLRILAERHPQGGRVAVFPCGAIQLAEREPVAATAAEPVAAGASRP